MDRETYRNMEQLTHEEAIAIYDSKCWESWDNAKVARLQLFQNYLFLPFGKFHEAVEEILCRPVWTHEFANRERLVDEMLGKRPAPTMQEIIDMIPEKKRIIIELPKQEIKEDV